MDLARALRAQGHRPEACGDVRVTAGACRGPLTKMGGRIKTWRRRWFLLDPRRRLLAYYGGNWEHWEGLVDTGWDWEGLERTPSPRR